MILEHNYPATNLELIVFVIPVFTYKTGGNLEIIEKYGGLIVE